MEAVLRGCFERFQQKNTREQTTRVKERGNEKETHEYFNVKRASESRAKAHKEVASLLRSQTHARTHAHTVYVVRKYFHTYCAYTLPNQSACLRNVGVSEKCQVGRLAAAVARKIRLNA